MDKRTLQNEKAIIDYHCRIAGGGFEALQNVTRFSCAGCGLCVSVCPLQSIVFDDTRKRPQLAGHCNQCGFCYLACLRTFLPLSKIEKTYHGRHRLEERERLGNFLDLFVARSSTEQIYSEGTPGGTTTALVHFMMEMGFIKAALLTKGKHFDIKYCMHPQPYIATSPHDVLLSSHSKFEISPVLSKLRELARYKSSLLVGTPCHILAFRKLQLIARDAVLSDLAAGLTEIAEKLTEYVQFAVSINCFLNHTSMDKIYEWLGINEKDIKKFNENVSKDLYENALNNGKDRRWFFKNNVVTNDGREIDYDVLEAGRRVLPSGCLVCNSLMNSKEADASIGFYGAETGVKEVGWNSVVVMNPELKIIFDEMVSAKKLERKPFLKGYGRMVRKTLEWLINHVMRTRDVMGVEQYLATGKWLYPKQMKKLKVPRHTYVLGLELIFLAQTLRKKVFYQAPLRELKKIKAHYPTIY